MFFSIQDKCKNLLVLGVFFTLGILLIEPIWQGSFVLIAIVLSRVIAKEHEKNKTYFDKEELSEYNYNYYFAFYRMLLSASYIFVAYRSDSLITLDIAFFSSWFAGYSIFWYITCFIPSDGEMTPTTRGRATGTMVILGIVLISMFAWMATTFKGVAWFSPMLIKPFNAIL